ncbi:UAA transporter [Gautieria morchelliformis]|nr:UAA transporter [Gautieria morchelliformis]
MATTHDGATIGEWVTTLSLVFGGCCRQARALNAWALERATAQHPDAGTLITFAQFVLVSAYGLRTHLVVAPAATHPVVVSPPVGLLGTLTRLRLKKRAIPLSRWAIQVGLFLVTSLLNNAAFAYDVPTGVHIIFRSGGLVVNMLMGWLIEGRRYNGTQILSVVLVTAGVVCTTLSGTGRVGAGSGGGDYAVGIVMLAAALVLSGLMGLAQDRAYGRYGRGHWEEGMFYLHFLALPGFVFVRGPLVRQMQAVAGGFYGPLGVNVASQVVCVAGVHRLTARADAVGVALVLVVRKAASLGLSAALGGRGGALLWAGAALVLAGTLGYARRRG